MAVNYDEEEEEEEEDHNDNVRRPRRSVRAVKNSYSDESSDEEEKVELTALLREQGKSDDYPEWSKVWDPAWEKFYWYNNYDGGITYKMPEGWTPPGATKPVETSAEHLITTKALRCTASSFKPRPGIS